MDNGLKYATYEMMAGVAIASMDKQGIAVDKYPPFARKYNTQGNKIASQTKVKVFDGPLSGTASNPVIEKIADESCTLTEVESCNAKAKPDSLCQVKLSFKEKDCPSLTATTESCKRKSNSNCKTASIDGEITRMRMFDSAAGFTLWST